MEQFKKKIVNIRLIPEDETLRPQFKQYRLQDVQELTWVNLMIYTMQFVVSIY